MKTQIEVGKKYKCRNGDTAIIKKDVSEIEETYCFRGDVLKNDGTIKRIAFWTPGGSYIKYQNSEFDIIENIV